MLMSLSGTFIDTIPSEKESVLRHQDFSATDLNQYQSNDSEQ
jgi:hypothetical protein